MIPTYPLCWPPWWSRTDPAKRQRSHFNTTFTKAMQEIHAEVRRLGARDLVVSSNVPTGSSGRPLASAARGVDDVGVAVYFTRKGEKKCIADDKFDKIEDNIHAIAMTIERIRDIERWGTSNMVDAAFVGFNLLPSPDDWRSELGHPTTREQAEAAYRQRSRTAHPDMPGGSHDRMARLNRAREAARAALS